MTDALLLKVTALPRGAVDFMDGPPFPGGEIDEIPWTLTWAPTPRVVYAATNDEGWSTDADHTPPNTHIPATFKGQFNFDRSLFEGVDPASRGLASVGALEIDDPEGKQDSLADLQWEGATVEVLRGQSGTDPASWETVARLTARAPLEGKLDSKTINLRDPSDQLGRALLHDTRYAGTGDYEGDAELRDQVRLMVLGGPVTNITLRRLLKNYPIYEASCTPVYSFDAVRDGGSAPLTPSGVDHATFALLKAAVVGTTIADGEYDTCKALGLLATCLEPIKDLTADVIGDTATINGFTRPITRADIVRRIACGRGSFTLAASQIDEASFTAFDAGQPDDCGFFFDQEITKADAIDRALRGCLGLWSMSLMGALVIDFLDDVPSTTVGTLSFEPPDGEPLIGTRIVDGPDFVESSAPTQTVYLGWAYNYTVQEAGALVGDVTPTNRLIYGQQCRKVSATDLALAISMPTAPILTIEESGFVAEAPAQAACDRIGRVLAKERERAAVNLAIDRFYDPLGEAWNVTNVARYAYGAARPMLVVAVKPTTDDEIVTWELWG